jgi:ABC-type sugar transport system ATPase subunit
MNTLPATMVVDAGEPFAAVGDGRLRLPSSAPPVAAGAPLVIGIRPEQLRLGADGIAACIKAVEWLGPERHVVCAVDDALVTLREAAEGPDPRPGDPVHLTCDPEDVQLFDPESGERRG